MDAGDAIGGLIGLGIGIVVADKVLDTIDEHHHHHHEEKESKPKKRKVAHYEEDNSWGGIF